MPRPSRPRPRRPGPGQPRRGTPDSGPAGGRRSGKEFRYTNFNLWEEESRLSRGRTKAGTQVVPNALIRADAQTVPKAFKVGKPLHQDPASTSPAWIGTISLPGKKRRRSYYYYVDPRGGQERRIRPMRSTTFGQAYGYAPASAKAGDRSFLAPERLQSRGSELLGEGADHFAYRERRQRRRDTRVFANASLSDIARIFTRKLGRKARITQVASPLPEALPVNQQKHDFCFVTRKRLSDGRLLGVIEWEGKRPPAPAYVYAESRGKFPFPTELP